MNDFVKIKQLFNITEDEGFSWAEITHGNIHQSLPKVLINYYRRLGKNKAINHTQDNLLAPNELRLSDNQDYLVFYVENQGVCVWGIAIKQLQEPNPTVYMSYDEQSWRPEADCLSDFLYAMAYLQAVFALPYNLEDFVSISKEEAQIIKQTFTQLGFAFTQWIGIEFYCHSDNDVIMVQKNVGDDQLVYDLLYAANNKDDFLALGNTLSQLGNW